MPKLLGQFLQEPQEPFALEVYLLERGCRRGTVSNARRIVCQSAKFLKSSNVKRRRDVVPNCSNFLRDVFCQFLMGNGSRKLKNGGSQNAAHEAAHCSEEGIRQSGRCGNFLLEKEVSAETNWKWTAVEDKNQLSPVSVLEETESDEVSPLQYTQGESSSSTSKSRCKLKQPTEHHSTFQELHELAGPCSYSQYIINRRTLLQTKQLVIDCVREVIERHRKRDERREILRADELRKLFCENVWLWSHESVDETNIVHLVHHHLLDSAEEWSADYEQHKMDISMDVGSAILEDVINEIVICLA